VRERERDLAEDGREQHHLLAGVCERQRERARQRQRERDTEREREAGVGGRERDLVLALHDLGEQLPHPLDLLARLYRSVQFSI